LEQGFSGRSRANGHEGAGCRIAETLVGKVRGENGYGIVFGNELELADEDRLGFRV
jgi:hypothetical protein